MNTIIIYDVKEKKVVKIHKLLKRYLYWIQNSVFEGDLTDGKYQELKIEIKKLINKEEDSVISFRIPDSIEIKKEIIGLEKNEPTNIL